VTDIQLTTTVVAMRITRALRHLWAHRGGAMTDALLLVLVLGVLAIALAARPVDH
jgi:hypothetical protein